LGNQHQSSHTESENLVYGLRPIIEAIEAGKEIQKVFVQIGAKGDLMKELFDLIKRKKIFFQNVPIEKLNRLTRNNHQGAVAYITEITYSELENVIPTIFEKGKVPLVLILDKVTDVRNFGAMVRTAECCGANAVLIPTRGSAPINADAIKTSAGAMHILPICRSMNLKDAIQYLKNAGLQIVACTEKSAVSYTTISYTKPTAIIMGSEEEGISPEYLKLCDAKAMLPLKGTIGSLNVSVAAGIILYEVLRQRNV
jgi:23S rRNA (guanosine2251-2'-O)-methyltransferase